MEIYYLIFGWTILLGFIDMYRPFLGKKGTRLFWLTVLLITLFKGLRWDTGTDFPQYLACFQNVTWRNFLHFERYGVASQYMEQGYTFINVLIKSIIDDYTVFLVLSNGIIMYAYGHIIMKYVPQYKFLCLALTLISTTLFPVRQTLAVAVIIYSIPYLLQHNLKKYLLCVLIAFSFHRSAIFLIFLYPVLVSDFYYKRNIAIYIL